MEESPTYTDLDAESSRKYTNLDSFETARAPHGQQYPQMTAPTGTSQPSSYHYGTGPGAPYQPPGNSHLDSSSYYNNGMMSVPRYPSHGAPSSAIPFQPQSGATNPSFGYPTEHGPTPFQNPPQSQYPMPAMGMPGTQQPPQQYPPNVNHQYLSQLHSEIEYYKNEINKMYVMPPSQDLAAKIRDFQNRVSYLEDKKHYLSMNASQAPLPSYNHGTPTPQNIPPHDPRMSYPSHDTPSYNNVQDYRNQCAYPPSNPTYPMYDKASGQPPASYQQPYGSYPGHPPGQPVGSVPIRPQVPVQPPGSYPSPRPAPGYPNPYSNHVPSNQTPHYGSNVMPAVSNSPNVIGHSGYSYQDPSLASKSSNHTAVAVKQVQPPGQKPSVDGKKTPKPETNPPKQQSPAPAANDRPKVAYTPQATSFVSSFVQNAFQKTKENSVMDPCAIVSEPVPIEKVAFRSTKPEVVVPVSGSTDDLTMGNVSKPEDEELSISRAKQEDFAKQLSAPPEAPAVMSLSSVANDAEEDLPKPVDQPKPNFEKPTERHESVNDLESPAIDQNIVSTQNASDPKVPDGACKSDRFIQIENSGNEEKNPQISQNFEEFKASESASPSSTSPAIPTKCVENAASNEDVQGNQPTEKTFSAISSSSANETTEKTPPSIPIPPSFDPLPVVVTSTSNQPVAPIYPGTTMSQTGTPLVPVHVAPPLQSRAPVPTMYHQPGFNPGAQPVPQPYAPPGIPPGPHIRGPMPPTGPYSGHWVASSGQIHGSPWVTTTSYPAIAPAGPLPPRQPTGPVAIAPRCHLKKSSISNRSTHTPDGKRIRKKKKETEEAVPDSTTSELGEPITSSCDSSSVNDLNLADQGSPYEEPTSSQTDIGSASTKTARKKKTDGTKRPKKGKKVKDSNEAEGIDVSSATLNSLELSSSFMDSNMDASEQELPSPSKTENCPVSKSSNRRPVKKLATKIGLNKKKRKRFDSSDEDLMPPVEASLIPEEFVEKRRSERNTAKTRRSYLTDDVIDYALLGGSDDDELNPSVVRSFVDETSSSKIEDSNMVEESANDTSATSNSAIQNHDSVETSSCSTIAGIEDGNSNSTTQQSFNSTNNANTNSAKDVTSSSACNNSAPQLLIPATIESDTCVVEKILTSRTVSPNQKLNEKPVLAPSDETKDKEEGKKKEDKVDEKVSPKISKDAPPNDQAPITEYFVKYKGLSYLHCEWATEEILASKDKRFSAKLKRFLQKKLDSSGGTRVEDYNEEEPFNPDFVEVDRVLDCMDSDEMDEATGLPKRNFLVKWCSLPYEESTWELEEDLDVQKIQQYFRVNNYNKDNTEKGLVRQHRPLFKEWKKMEETPVFKNNNELRDYQLEGINWLLYCYYKQTNCILADEMGLGKTVQSITFLESVYRLGIKGPFLIIAPLSTILNWQREFEGWTDQNCIVYHGSQTSRNMIQQYEMFHKDPKTKHPNRKKFKFTALVTTYEVLLADCLDLFREIDWRVCIIDEAHRLKNKKCKLMDGLNMLSLEHVVLLTGTPLQNNVDELFSLLNFLDPLKFSNNHDFLQEFGSLQTEEQVNKLQAILKPLMLRRLKEDVERSIAPKEETIIEVELTNVQKSWYRAIIEKNFSHIAKSSSSGVRALPNLMNTMMELRKCCNHPFLLNGVEEQILQEFGTSVEGTIDARYLDALIQSCGKIVLIDKLLPKLKEGNHRVLIFSQMVKCLDIIEDYINHRNYSYERIDGGVRGLMRQAAIDRFSKPGSDKFIFLLCTKAGGLGINLTAADTVIIYDSDWNPQNDLQAQARCHRIGQRKHVQVYRLITRNTYEREMFDRASQKLGLDKAVLQSMAGRGGVPGSETQNAQNSQLSKKEVEDLLKKGAYGAVMEDDDAAQKFCEEDIDLILKKRTQVIKIESEAAGSTFSKASFTSNDANNDIDLNDPNFWEKWARKANVDYDGALKDDRIIDVPRLRRQTRRFEYSQVNEDMYGISDSDSDGSGSADSAGAKGSSQNGNGSKRSNKKKGGTNTDDNSSDGGQEFVRSDLYQCEKGLLTYGWGNWVRIIEEYKFRRDMTTKLVEDLCRYILAYALLWYQGDEKIQTFIRELIAPENDDMECLKSHAAQSSVAPRGRKSSRKQDSNKPEKEEKEIDDSHWSSTENLEAILCDSTFRKHVRYQCNKVLIRVRTLFYIHHEVIEDLAEKVNSGAHHKDIPLDIPHVDVIKPAEWWDETCDKCLFLGVFKHGYDQFARIRNDPNLCFLEIVGEAFIGAEGNEEDLEIEEGETANNANVEDEDSKPNKSKDETECDKPTSVGADEKKQDEEAKEKCKEELGESADTEDTSQDEVISQESKDSADIKTETESETNSNDAEKNLWPAASAINNRLRKVISALQKLSKKQKAMMEKRKMRMDKMAVLNPVPKPQDIREKWAKREENDFYKVISTFGLQYAPNGDIVWNKFRMLASLHRKSDIALNQYYEVFKSMCEKVCGVRIIEEKPPEEPPSFNQMNPITVEPITEDRARRTLHRIELMKRIRFDALNHPEFDKRIQLCQPGLDMPSWWIAGEHDKDLMIGVANHGLARSEVNLLQDPQLCFCKVKDHIMKTVQENHDEKVARFKKEKEISQSVILKDPPLVEQGAEQGPVGTETINEVAPEKQEGSQKIKVEGADNTDATVDKEVADGKSEMGEEVETDKVGTTQTVETTPEVETTLKYETTKQDETIEKDETAQKEETINNDGTSKTMETNKCETETNPVTVATKETVEDVKETIQPQLEKMEPSEIVKSEIKMESDIINPMKTASPAPVNITDMLGIAYLVQWPKDRVLVSRLEKICHCIETGSWPCFKWNQPIVVNNQPMSQPFADKDGVICHPTANEDPGEIVAGALSKQQQQQLHNMNLIHDMFGAAVNRGPGPEVNTVVPPQIPTSKGKGRGRGSANSTPTHLPSNLRRQNSATPTGGNLKEEAISRLRDLFEKQNGSLENELNLSSTSSSAGGSGTGMGAGIMDLSMKPPISGATAGTISGKYTNSERSTPDSRADDADISDQGSGTFAGSDSTEMKKRAIGSAKRKRKQAHTTTIIDPSKLDLDSINGNEHVAVVDRISGVKVEGNDAPMLNNIIDFLYKNPMFDIAPEWEVIVKAQKSYPADLLKRVANVSSSGVGSPDSKKLKQSGKQLYSPARSTQSSTLTSDLLSQAGIAPNLMGALTSSPNPFGVAGSLGNIPSLTPDLATLGLFNPMLSAAMFPSPLSGTSSNDQKSASSIAAAAAQSAALNYHLASLAAVSLNPLLAQSLNPFSASMPGLNPFGLSNPGTDAASFNQLASLSALLGGSMPPTMTPESLLGSLTPQPSNTPISLSESTRATSVSSPTKQNNSMSPTANTSSRLDSSPGSSAISSTNAASPPVSKLVTPPSTPSKQSSSNTGTPQNSIGNQKSQSRTSSPAVAVTSTLGASSSISDASSFPGISQLSANDLLTAASLGSLPFMLPSSMPFLPPNLLQSSASSSSNASVPFPGLDLGAGLEAAQLAALASLCAGNSAPSATSVPTSSLNNSTSPLYPHPDLSRLGQVDSLLNEQTQILERMQRELLSQQALELEKKESGSNKNVNPVAAGLAEAIAAAAAASSSSSNTKGEGTSADNNS